MGTRSPADVLLLGLPRLDELVARSLERLFELRVGRGEDRDDVAVELVVFYLFAEPGCLCDSCIVIDALHEAVTGRAA